MKKGKKAKKKKKKKKKKAPRTASIVQRLRRNKPVSWDMLDQTLLALAPASFPFSLSLLSQRASNAQLKCTP